VVVIPLLKSEVFAVFLDDVPVVFFAGADITEVTRILMSCQPNEAIR